MTTPKEIAEAAKKLTPADSVKEEGMYNEGFQAGRSRARQDFLDWLQQRYMSDDSHRDNDLGKAILQITRELSKEFSLHTPKR